ncbi:MAG: hypothetical protein Q6373_018825 [Candidatus Sigynarchaeota archaeon]
MLAETKEICKKHKRNKKDLAILVTITIITLTRSMIALDNDSRMAAWLHVVVYTRIEGDEITRRQWCS